MRTVAALTAILLASGGALGQVLYHDNPGVMPMGPVVQHHVTNPGQPGNEPRGGSVVYSSTTETGSRYLPGGGTVQDNRRVAIDDIPIPVSITHGVQFLEVCRVTVGIRRLANAPATDIGIYSTTFTTNPAPVAPDTVVDTPPTLIGTVHLDATAVAITQLVSLGVSGGPALFTVPLNYDLISTFGTFGLGVTISETASNTQGWRLTTGPAPNADVFWQYDPGHTGQANDEGQFFFGAPPAPRATFYAIIEGTAMAPAPGAASLLVLGGLLVGRRRR